MTIGRTLRSLLPVLALWAAACAGPEKAADLSAPELPGSSVTLWTASTELFMEVPALLVNQPEKFAVHLTRLSDATPLRTGPVTFRFKPVDGGEALVVMQAEPRAPGIFGPAPSFARAGTYDLVIEIASPDLTDRIEVPGLTVYAAAADVPHEHGESDAGGIAFLKEQAWKTEGFQTAFATTGRLAEIVAAPARVTPAAGFESWITAPIAGRFDLARPDAVTPGRMVRRGETLARLWPMPGDGGSSLPEARRELADAEAEMTRVTRLSKAGAIPTRRVAEVENRLRAARESLAGLPGKASSDGSVQLIAAIDGQVVEVRQVTGVRVEPGEPLIRILNPRRLWLVVDVASPTLTSPGDIGPVTYRIEGEADSRRSGDFVGSAPEIDPVTRSRRLIFNLDNSAADIQAGSLAQVELPTGQEQDGVLIAASAVIEEDGQPIAYVQVSGESFERRTLTVGARNGDQVLVLAGINAGERIVTGAAFQIRLASLSTSVPAHGHAH